PRARSVAAGAGRRHAPRHRVALPLARRRRPLRRVGARAPRRRRRARRRQAAAARARVGFARSHLGPRSRAAAGIRRSHGLQGAAGELMRIGWIGTGVMGASMCGHLLAKGNAVTLYTRTRAKAEPLVARGAAWADSPRAVADASDVVFT